MEKKIKKRDNRIVNYDFSKIETAIWKAARSVGGSDRERAKEVAKKVDQEVEKKLQKHEFQNSIPTVEEIQDIVEKVLVENGHYKTAKAYILYRKRHEELRDMKGILTSLELIDDYIGGADWRIKENSNMTYSLQGLNFHVSSIISSNYWTHKIYTPEIGRAHNEGDLHIHDLGIIGAYCVGWDLKDLLIQGFTGVRGKITSKPAKHFRSALGQIVNFFYTLQGEAAGAQAISNFDTLLAPFIRYDNLNYQQVKQALQEFVFNVNVPTRVGFQTPFTNITMDLKVPQYMKDEAVIIGGQLQNETYSDFQKEVNILNKAFAEVMYEGDGNGRVFTFPIPTYNITKDFEWNNSEYDYIWKMTAKYGIPYFSNFINSDMSPDDARSMCCRLRLDKRELRKRGGGLFGANPLTGSIGVVTINLPRLGYLSSNEQEFFDKLDYLMDLAKESLETKRVIIERFTEQGLYPYSKFYLRNIKKAYGQYWKNNFSTIGLVGMNEAALNFIGKDITTKEGHEFANKVLLHMRDKLGNYQEETGSIYNLEATPGEGTSFRLARIDKKKFPSIIVANEEKALRQNAPPYYTNSSQLPVGYTQDLYNALNLQDPLQTKYTGGTVFHIFLGEALPTIESVKNLIKKICETYSMPYVSLTPTFSICPIHGYLSGEHEYCPKCLEQDENKQEVVANEN